MTLKQATVCSYKQVVCHHVAAGPSRKYKAQAERLWIETRPASCKSLSCLFRLGLLNSDIYILCPAEVSPACLKMPKLTLFSMQTSNIYRCRGKSSCTEGNVWISADWGLIFFLNKKYIYIYKKKNSGNVICDFSRHGVKYVIVKCWLRRVQFY